MATSARGLIENTLARYGLRSLASWAWNKYLRGDSVEEIMLELRETRSYKNRFPAMQELAESGRGITEEEYISYEQTIRRLAQQHGLSPNRYGSRSYIAELLTRDISPTEAQARMELAQAASTTAPQEYKEQASRLYGIGRGDWESIWLETDRTLPELEKQFAAASVAGEATLSNLGEISRQQAERMVEAGVTREQARQGFASVSTQLAQRLPGEVESGLGRNWVAGGSVGLSAADALQRRRRQRISRFAGGGQAAATERGVTGIGTASS